MINFHLNCVLSNNYLKNEKMKLKNKIAVITGAASGIGKAQAVLFASEGAEVIAIDSNIDAVKDVILEIHNSKGLGYALQLDVTDEKAVKETISNIIQKHNRIDILCNTAGVFDGFAKSLDTPLTLWDKLMNVNARAVFILCNSVLPHMIEKKQGSIVNMASIGSYAAGAGGVAYTSSKHAVLGLTKQLTMDYAGYGIRVNAVAPGLIETPLNRDFFQTEGSGIKEVIATIPVHRAGQADEVAKVSLFLASDDASYIYGTAIIVDGGVTATLT
ncbi:SDR family NAD(P)-dependent oxidoreductase [Flavobacterium sp. FlaQc-47]|uniref:SDR family NAD(P)-dependent oxidoreductase n=1 Tax=Flavobacterium sp. FlaQc-47 TaxID=3374180 RepID=UPI00375734CC